MTKDLLSKQWDQVAPILDCDAMRPVRYAKIIRYINSLPRNIKILEVGCGEGSGLMFLQQLGFINLWGVEISQTRLDFARDKLGTDVVLLRQDPCHEQLPCDDNFFDVVISAAVIEHVKDSAWFLKELSRVARDSGSVIISSDCWQWRILQILGLYKSVQPIDQTFFPTKFFKLFKDNNLQIKHYEGFAGEDHELHYRFIKALGNGLKLNLEKLFLAKYWGYRLNRFLKKSPKKNCNVKMNQFSTQQILKETPINIDKQSHASRILNFMKIIFSDENVFYTTKQSTNIHK